MTIAVLSLEMWLPAYVHTAEPLPALRDNE